MDSDVDAEEFTVLVQFPDGECGEVDAIGSWTVGALRRQIGDVHGRSLVTSKVTYDGVELTHGMRLADCGVGADSLVCMQMQIYVGFLARTGFLIDVNPWTSVGEVKALVNSDSRMTTPGARRQRLFAGGIHVDNDLTLAQCDVADGANLFLLEEENPAPRREDCIQVFIRCDERLSRLDVPPTATVDEVRRQACHAAGLPDSQRLSFGGNYLENPTRTLWDCGIHGDCLLYLVPESSIGVAAELGPGPGGGARTGGKASIDVFLLNPEAGEVPFELQPDAPLRDAFEAYARLFNAPAARLSFTYGAYEHLPPDCDLTAAQLAMDDGDTILVHDRRAAAAPLSAPRTPNEDRRETSFDLINLTAFSGAGASPMEEVITITIVAPRGAGANLRVRMHLASTTLGLAFGSFADHSDEDPATLFYVFGARRFPHDADDTAAQAGIEDGSVLHALEKGMGLASPPRAEKIALYLRLVGDPDSEKEFFKPNIDVRLAHIFQSFASRKNMDTSKLRFLYRGEILYADSWDETTPAQLGIQEHDILDVLVRGNNRSTTLTPSAIKTMEVMSQNHTFEPVLQVLQLDKTQRKLTVSDGTSSLSLTFHARLSGLVESGVICRFAVILASDISVEAGRSPSLGKLSLLDAEEASPNPGRILGYPPTNLADPDAIAPRENGPSAAGNLQRTRQRRLERLEKGLPYLRVCHNESCSRICDPGVSSDELKVCSRCRFVGYCSPECQRQSWNGRHKTECSYLKASHKFAKDEFDEDISINITDVFSFWSERVERLGPSKPLTKDVASRVCNSSLCCAFQLAEADLHPSMVKAYILSAAYLTQLCSTPTMEVMEHMEMMEHLYDPGIDGAALDRFLLSVPFLKAGVQAISSKASMEKYLAGTASLSSEVLAREKLQALQLRQVKAIIARNVIADFVWRRHEESKARKAIAEFVRHYIQRVKARKTISGFVWRRIALRRRQKLRKSAKTVQRVHRGHSTRKLHGHQVQARLKEFRRFSSIWKQTVDQVPTSIQPLTGWALVREKINVKKMEFIDDDGNLADTDEKLTRALPEAQLEESEADDSGETDIGSGLEDLKMEESKSSAEETPVHIDWSNFQVTTHVVKFIKNGDAKYREIFVKKIKQLAKGERSHKLMKPLKGCESIIYESYLENKSGFRILWTQEGKRIIVWFVAKHKSVSRLAKLIDDAKQRTARQQMPKDFVSELESVNSPTTAKSDILLDALGNVPLKLYDVGFDNLNDMAKKSWSPRMHLTEEERQVVEAKGTVLLLGRSGTGKTVCICNRIEFDRQRLGEKANFSQLFVSKSSQLCRYVKQVAEGSSKRISFITFDKLVGHLLESLLIKSNFHPSQHVNFSRFNQDFYTVCYPQANVNPLIAWKAIRTFIKGSIEAFKTSEGSLSRDYFTSGKLGKNRCKVPPKHRSFLYDVFVEYKQWIHDHHLWDDCDCVFALLKGIEEAKRSQSCIYEEKIKRSKIYVDEVQDYTQLEILLFFYVGGGPGALFLAGDPAQSVVVGTDFRFEEVRSVGHFVAGSKKRHLIPDKPKIVNVNFRSHAGVLNCAGGFLDLLFGYFPGSAKQLKKDYGLFKGARPGVFQHVQIQQLSSLLREKMPGAVVLVHDDSASQWRDMLGHKLVYGIREAKGMEFKSVIILDFFSELPLQKPWRDLLLNRYREGSDFESQFPLVETHLKLVYTAVTRCIEQLFFAETKSSIAGDAAVRWLTTTMNTKNQVNDSEALATINKVKDLESMTMTNDEFCVVGLDNAELASDSEVQFKNALNYLDRAMYCFQEAQSSELVAKAQAHCESVQLREQLVQIGSPKTTHDRELVEGEAARVLELLLKENLLTECIHLLRAIAPFLSPYTQQKLEETATSRIRHILTA